MFSSSEIYGCFPLGILIQFSQLAVIASGFCDTTYEEAYSEMWTPQASLIMTLLPPLVMPLDRFVIADAELKIWNEISRGRPLPAVDPAVQHWMDIARKQEESNS
jgi:hypothetical protein